MYGKIFETIYDGTLYGQWEALVTFQQLIVLADKNGIVDMTTPALAARTSIPLDIITKGIEVLENSDPYSRTEGSDGRRLDRLDDHRPWGWIIINYQVYRDLQSKLEKSEYDKQRYQGKVKKGTIPQNSTDSTHTDTDTDTDNNTASIDAVSPRQPCPYQKIIELYHEILPGHPRVKVITDKRKSHMRARWSNGADTLKFWRDYFEAVAGSKFLTGRTLPSPGRKTFMADIDFLIREDVLVKTQEGKYHE